MAKNLPAIQGYLGLIPGSRRSPVEVRGYHLHILSWRIPWAEVSQSTAHGVRKSQTWLSYLTLSFHKPLVKSNILISASLSYKIYWELYLWDFPGGSEVKTSACNAGDLDSIPGLGRSPGEGNGNPLQYSCLENPSTEEPGGLQSTGSQRVGHDWAISLHFKNLKQMGIPNYLTCLLRNLYAGQEATVRIGHGTTDWFQIGKGVRQGCILSPCLFNFDIQSTSWETLGWRKHKLESRLPGEISITSDMQMTPPLWQKVKKN